MTTPRHGRVPADPKPLPSILVTTMNGQRSLVASHIVEVLPTNNLPAEPGFVPRAIVVYQPDGPKAGEPRRILVSEAPDVILAGVEALEDPT